MYRNTIPKEQLMDRKTDLFIKNYLDNMNAEVIKANRSICGRGWGTSSSVYSVHKFYYINSGEAYFKIQNEEFQAKTGQLFCFPAGTKQTFHTVNSQNIELYWCHFTVSPANNDLFDKIVFPYCIDVNDLENIHRIFHGMAGYRYSETVTARIHLKSLLLELIAFYIDNLPQKIHPAVQKSAMYKLLPALNHIHNASISKNISVDELAAIVGLHPNYFLNMFKTYMGTTPAKYMNERKIIAAKKLLSDNSNSITDISIMLGFEDVHYFSNAFKKYTGCAPSKYRAMQMHMDSSAV